MYIVIGCWRNFSHVLYERRQRSLISRLEYYTNRRDTSRHISDLFRLTRSSPVYGLSNDVIAFEIDAGVELLSCHLLLDI